MAVETPWADIWLSADDWAEAFEAPDPGTPHNEARDQVWEELLTILVDKVDDERRRRRTSSAGRCAQNTELRDRLHQGVAAARADRPRRRPVVGARLPAPVRALARARRGAHAAAPDPQAWTVADLPLLDAARQRLGDPEASRRRRRREAAVGRRARADGARWSTT